MAHPHAAWGRDLLRHDLTDVEDREHLLEEVEDLPETPAEREPGAGGHQQRHSRFQALRPQHRLLLVASMGALSLAAWVFRRRDAGASPETAEPRHSGALQRWDASGSGTPEVGVSTGSLVIPNWEAANKEVMDQLAEAQGDEFTSAESATLVPAPAESTSPAPMAGLPDVPTNVQTITAAGTSAVPVMPTSVPNANSTAPEMPLPPTVAPTSSGVREILKQKPLAGVNLGGWLCLEDWFFSGADGSHVMSAGHVGQGACLPPMVTDLTEKWPSEGILTNRLQAEKGSDFAIQAFKAHRDSFITDTDLEQIASLGIKHVRVPVHWGAFADALAPISKEVYGSHDPDHDTVIVPDPFYKDDASLATIPRSFLEEFLLKAQQYGLKVVWDLHAFPGGAQLGTYNTVWPMDPVFWKERDRVGTVGYNLTDAGSWVAQALINWIQNLDDTKRAVVAGVCLMNEPAHMNRWKEFANENLVREWLAGAGDMFRRSFLPGQGVKLYMNLMDTGFKDFANVTVPWFLRTFSDEERHTWAVADTHWYAAWTNGECDGRTTEGGAYACDGSAWAVIGATAGCVKGEVENMHIRFGDGLICFSEISVGTFEDARYACKDKRVTSIFLNEMMIRFNEANVQGFFWSWRMPYAPVFEPGWSLKSLAGLEDPASQRLACR